jgi:cephalosporin-C deacetylase-like acetyl esterase
MRMHAGYLLVAIAVTLLPAVEPSLSVLPQKPDATWQIGEQVTWTVTVTGSPTSEASYVLKRGGLTIAGQGTLPLVAGKASIQTTLDAPGTVLAEVTVKIPGGKDLAATGGAVVAPANIAPSMKAPDDFDAFWKAKLAELAAVPENPMLMAGSAPADPDPAKTHEQGTLGYWTITLDNIRGTKVHGQLARPVGDKKLPALLLVQYAGVYPLPQANVTGYASQGWLALNIMAHDLPINEPPAYYQKLTENELKNYTAIGNDDREKSYFLRMYLACYRAVDYLASRPDWDGRTLVVSGTSQGGLQSFIAAALHPKVSALLALVPAGCDDTAPMAGRAAGWPYWLANTQGKDPAKVLETARYYDAVNFAPRVTCPALVGVGLIDLTARAAGIYAAVNQFTGPKEVVVLPLSDHHGTHGAQAPFHARMVAWLKALRLGQPVPAQ